MKHPLGLIAILVLLCNSIVNQPANASDEDPISTQYMVGGTAFQLKEGELQFNNTLLLVNSLNYGLSDHFSVGAGTELYTTFWGESADRLPNLYFMNAKAGCSLTRNLRLSGGYEIALFRAHLFADDSNDGIPSISLAYGLLTYGSATNNLTLGAYLPAVNWLHNVSDPIYTLGGTFRIGRATSIVAEAWMPSDRLRVIDGGFRFFGKSSAIDLGLLYVVGYTFPIPILEYTLKF